jgi:hypothetical protein
MWKIILTLFLGLLLHLLCNSIANLAELRQRNTGIIKVFLRLAQLIV